MSVKSIESYHSASLQLAFKQNYKGEIWAEKPAEPIKVELPVSETFAQSLLPQAEKIQRLLRNRHLRLVHNADQNSIHFEPIPGQKTWVTEKTLPLPPNAKWIARSDGTISYIAGNQVVNWNWVEDKCKSKHYNGILTALAEMPDGSLIVSDNQGNVYFNSEEVHLGLTGVIDKIIPFSSNLALIKVAGKGYQVLNLNDTTSPALKAWIKKLIPVGNNCLIALIDKKIKLYEFDAEGIYEVIENPFGIAKKENKNILGCQRFLNTNDKLLIKKEKKYIVLDIANAENENPLKLEPESLITKPMLVGQKIAYGCEQRKIYVLDTSSEEDTSIKGNGNWSIQSFIPLSDDSVMLTIDRCAIIANFFLNGTSIWKEEKAENAPPITFLTELIDGSVAAQFGSSVIIIEPRFDSPVDVKEKIQSLKSKMHSQTIDEDRELICDDLISEIREALKNNPYDFELYTELLECFSEEMEQEKYQIYLSGLEAALRSNDLYKARQFYKKARKIQRDNPKASEILYKHLLQSPYTKFLREVALDLYRLTKNKFFLEKIKKCKQRLFIGEGTFTYTKALIKKHSVTHPELPKYLTATEIENPIDEPTSQRWAQLIDLGVTVLFGIDGQNIHTSFKGRRFERIHWNCPFGGSSTEERKEFKSIIPAFFKSASQIQLVGDRIHITLLQESKSDYWRKRQTENPIVFGSVSTNYTLIRKRVFGRERYPDYTHAKTNSSDSHDPNGIRREFVFEKTDKILPDLIPTSVYSLKKPSIKEYKIKTAKSIANAQSQDLKDYFFECSSDDDSSDYYDSD
jgi:hypothetical protein